jgi:ABC-type sugar transport system substrate-binding protein
LPREREDLMTRYTHGTTAFAKNLALASVVAAALTSGLAFLQIAVADSAVDAVVAVDKAGVKLAKPARVAYLAECVQNAYCQARLKGITDAAAKFGFEFKVFDANFNPFDQLKQVQNAVMRSSTATS